MAVQHGRASSFERVEPGAPQMPQGSRQWSAQTERLYASSSTVVVVVTPILALFVSCHLEVETLRFFMSGLVEGEGCLQSHI